MTGRKREGEVPGARMPHSDPMEQAMLGSLMLDHSVWQSQAYHLNEEHFYVNANRTTWQAIEGLLRAGMVPDLVSVQAALEKSGRLSAAGGVERLVSLADLATAAYAESYMSALEEYRYLRTASNYGMQLQRAANESDVEGVSELMSSPPTDNGRNKTLQTTGEANRRLLEQLESELHDEVTRVRITNIPALNELLTGGGFRPGQLIVLAARPGMGKSVLAHNFASSAATNWGPVLFSALEMSSEELQERALAAALGENPRTIIKREGEAGLARVAKMMPMTEVPIIYDDLSTQTVEHIAQAAHRVVTENGSLAMVVVDYLQLIEAPRGMSADPVHAIANISKRLKQMARKLECPVIVLSQLSRAVEKRVDRRPIMSDLRDSGAIEQDADIVMFIYRDHYYNREADPHETEIIVAKQRGGDTDTILVNFNKGSSVFVGR